MGGPLTSTSLASVGIDSRPIGVFDSGVGGLTVVRALREALPNEALLYLGDTARLPYGTKSPETVTHYSQANVDWLTAAGAKAVVVACNTASATALPALESDLPVWGVVRPGAQRALEVTSGRVGVIATEATVRSDAYAQAINAGAAGRVAVKSIACPLFVPLVEEGWLEDPVTETVARRYLEPLLDWRMDTLVLGCTHYPLLASLLRRIVGSGVEVVDSARSLALQVRAAARATPVSDTPAVDHPGSLRLCFTDQSDRYRILAETILGEAVLAAASLEWVDLSQ